MLADAPRMPPSVPLCSTGFVLALFCKKELNPANVIRTTVWERMLETRGPNGERTFDAGDRARTLRAAMGYARLKEDDLAGSRAASAA